MRVFRLHRRSRPAADYQGSLIQSNRWNPTGVPILYCSAALSLACLEVLVHLTAEEIPPDYVYSSAELPKPTEDADFQGELVDADATRRYGHYWVRSRRSLAILVPSVVIPEERNALLNPLHPDFSEIEWSAPRAFRFDRRLLGDRLIYS